MLVLSRRQGERVVIGEDVEIVVLEVHGHRVKLGFAGPREVPIHRQELLRQMTAPAADCPALPPLVAAD